MSGGSVRLRVRGSGDLVTLEPARKIGAGGEAVVYGLAGSPHLVAKHYKSPSAAHEAKLRVMVENPPPSPQQAVDGDHVWLAWPNAILETEDRRFAGYTMSRIAKMGKVADVWHPKTRRVEIPDFTYRYLVSTARNIAGVVSAVHGRGYVIGDVNESNVLVSGRALVTLVDADSFQVKDPRDGRVYRCPVGKPDFTPPELQGQSFTATDRKPEHDAFGLAVLLFQLLFEGVHPFHGIDRGSAERPETAQRISEGCFPYSPYGARLCAPRPHVVPFGSIPGELSSLFLRAFDHPPNGSNRPAAAEWARALAICSERLLVCTKNERHLYFDHNKSCTWCDRAAGGIESFPSPHTPAASGTRRAPSRSPRQGARSTSPVAAQAIPVTSALGAAHTPAMSFQGMPGSVSTARPKVLGIAERQTFVSGGLAALAAMTVAMARGFAHPLLTIVGVAPVIVGLGALGYGMAKARGKNDSIGCAVILLALMGLGVISTASSHPVFWSRLGLCLVWAMIAGCTSEWLGRSTQLRDYRRHGQVLAVLLPFAFLIGTAPATNDARAVGSDATAIPIATAPVADVTPTTNAPASAGIVAARSEASAQADMPPSVVENEGCPNTRVCVYRTEDETRIVARVLPNYALLGWSQAGEGWYSVKLQTGAVGFVKAVDLPRLGLPKPQLNVELP